MPATKKSVRTPRKNVTNLKTVSSDQRRAMIAEAAYFRAEQRGFEGGDPISDWLLSEQEVDQILSQDID